MAKVKLVAAEEHTRQWLDIRAELFCCLRHEFYVCAKWRKSRMTRGGTIKYLVFERICSLEIILNIRLEICEESNLKETKIVQQPTIK